MADDRTVAEVDGRRIELTNLDKLLWPDEGITKADLIHYIFALSPFMLPHLAGRPLTVTRYPDGVNGEGFYQKDCPAYAPEWIPTYPVPSKEGGKRVTRYILPNEPATLVWLANQAAIEFHPWMSRAEDPLHPDYFVIDLDPNQGATFDDVRLVAKAVKELLDHMGLVSFPKLSGATGIHVYVPLEPEYSYEETSAFAGHVGKVIAAALPEKATNERLVKNRGPRVYIDHLQNLPGKTIVCPFSPRPRRGAPVSAPFFWDELDTIVPGQFSVKEIDRLLERSAAFQDLYRHRQRIDRHLERLG